MSILFFEEFLKMLQPHSLLEISGAHNEYVSLDLSVTNQTLQNIDVSSSVDLERFIWGFMKIQNAKVAYGGYLEKRSIYNRSDYFNKQNPETERNIHIGLDIWTNVNAPIFAPLEGEIHSFKNNTNYGDYGPTLILKHHFEGIEFYTLYGHLSLQSIRHIRVGDRIIKGQQIATLGTAEVNGDYPPHLHFQIIKDMQHFQGDYPGVSNLSNLDFYKTNCPDPNLLLELY
jgi:murein DD-endopeptidase MepM/ murein hydrolase activator NlpD